MRLAYTFFALCLLGLLSCNTHQNSAQHPDANLNKEEKNTTLPQSKLNDDGTQMLVSLVNHYYRLKNALVADNTSKADSTADEMIPITDSLIAFSQKNSPYLLPSLDTIKGSAMAVTAIKEHDYDKKRRPFSIMSDALYRLVKNAGLKNAGIYYDHCPMAFDEKGANWLSNTADINNPYENKMHDCGEIADSLK
jgi:hypothetical protein